MSQRTYSKIPGFRLGVFVFRDAEIVDYAAPYGVFSVAVDSIPSSTFFSSLRRGPILHPRSRQSQRTLGHHVHGRPGPYI
jgi:hypothetical protein